MIGIACLALLAALGSAAVSWRALDQARTARDIASARSPLTAPPAEPGDSGASSSPTPAGSEPAPGGSGEPGDTPRSPGEPPELNPQTVYKTSYEAQSLTLKPADCSSEMYVDLDEPRANVGFNGAEFALEADCQAGAPYIQLRSGVRGSEAARAGMKPQECWDAIRAAPIADEDEVPLRKGGWLCIHTNYTQARERRDDWRMVLIEVVSISNERAVVIRSTAWNIPDD
ncbi:hypothetical protein OG777_00535 [Micromonospora peucetia]|uniref:Serine/threonine protein kinase n=1 Tax=Micromonospora peucetia TaxID=47871 RepID=A0ABZ1EGP8_9ACTN|nr:hypothetical protein [Micromonospora peucetia]MCX4385413.1 hypothetical protein [Micromonospora peucetia]WSA32810.1 hypothetical protein OIE14_01650 [Micromonospora peucetia]